MRLIDADALGIGYCNPDVFDDKGYAKGWNSVIEILKNSPTVDAVPVTFCEKCKYWARDWEPIASHGNEHYCPLIDLVVGADFFCKYGECNGVDNE